MSIAVNAHLPERLDVRFDFTTTTTTGFDPPVDSNVSEYVRPLGWDFGDHDISRQDWCNIATATEALAGTNMAGFFSPFADPATDVHWSTSGEIFRFGFPVPFKVRYDLVTREIGTETELSRASVEHAFDATDASALFSVSEPGAGYHVVLEDLVIVTPVVSSY